MKNFHKEYLQKLFMELVVKFLNNSIEELKIIHGTFVYKILKDVLEVYLGSTG